MVCPDHPPNLAPLTKTFRGRKAGSSQEVTWGFLANHGGGYRYSLAPKPCVCPPGPRQSLLLLTKPSRCIRTGFRGNLDLTEELFNEHLLKFVGDTQWVQDNFRRNRTAIRAMRTSEGTFPRGSQWTRVPIPECITLHNTAGGDLEKCLGLQFPAPCPDCYGFFGDPNERDWNKTRDDAPIDMSIVDLVAVPKDLKPGEYIRASSNGVVILSLPMLTCGVAADSAVPQRLRADPVSLCPPLCSPCAPLSAQAARRQIWESCADILVTAA